MHFSLHTNYNTVGVKITVNFQTIGTHKRGQTDTVKLRYYCIFATYTMNFCKKNILRMQITGTWTPRKFSIPHTVHSTH